MSKTTVVQPTGPDNRRWILPLVLVLIIAGIILAAYFATHRSSGKSAAAATRTPTAIPSPTPTLLPTATAPAGAAKTTAPTATPRPAPTATPRPAATPRTGPTPTARPASTPAATPSTSTVKLGTFTYQQSTLRTIQQGADAGNQSYTFYVDPFKVVGQLLPQNYGFNAGSVTIVAPPPPPQPTPTPYNNAQGLPEIKVTVQYQGKRYVIVLDQPETQGPKGIWIIFKISQA